MARASDPGLWTVSASVNSNHFPFAIFAPTDMALFLPVQPLGSGPAGIRVTRDTPSVEKRAGRGRASTPSGEKRTGLEPWRAAPTSLVPANDLAISAVRSVDASSTTII